MTVTVVNKDISKHQTTCLGCASRLEYTAADCKGWNSGVAVNRFIVCPGCKVNVYVTPDIKET
jgi:hypothetical protein